MATSFFGDKAVIPDDPMVDAVLAGQKAVWHKLKAHVSQNYQDASQSWRYYSKKAGWSLVFKAKDRALFYFIPRDGYFMISLVFGEAAVKAAEQAPIPDSIKEAIAAATPYVEGRSFSVDVKDEGDLDAVLALIRIKAES